MIIVFLTALTPYGVTIPQSLLAIPTLKNYQEVWRYAGFRFAFVNAIFVASAVTDNQITTSPDQT